MFEKIYQILVQFLGESKQGFYSKETTQYQFNCPCCTDENGGIPDGKYNLEVLLSPDKGLKYHCWKCGDINGTRGNLANLIKRYGSRSLYHDFKAEIENLRTLRLYDINLYTGVTINNEIVYLKLPKTFKKINLSKCNNKTLVAYLNKRKITQDIIDKFNIGYTSWDDDYSWRNRIIVPSYDTFGDLNYFVGRDFTGKSKMKYKNCDADKTSIIYQESLIDWDSTIYLCEGVFDSLYFPNSIALLGKSLKKENKLYQSLMSKANANVVIVLDADTYEDETKKIYSSLNFGRLYNKVRYIRLDKDKDFGEIYEHRGKKGMIDIIRQAKQYNEIELIR